MLPIEIILDENNIGSICTRQQCLHGKLGKVAMRWIPASGDKRDYTFADLESESNRLANVLTSLEIVQGDVIFTLLPKMPEQFFTVLGSLKKQLVTGTLFANFGEEALLDRLGDAAANVLVTKKSFLKKIERIREQLPALRYVLVVDLEDHRSETILSYHKLTCAASTDFVTSPTSLDAPSLLHYTSGSTGKPKGVLHRHNSIHHQYSTTRDVFGLTEDDVFWCTADQGWVTGTSYGIIGPWSHGVTQVHYGGGYDAATWFRLLQDEKITVWYTAPTALRMLMREDEQLFRQFDLSRLKHIFSVGEPLNPEVIQWARRVLDKEVYDTWFQTETGGIMISNRPGIDIRPGSMGKPLSGIEPAILADDGSIVVDGVQGNLCIKSGWPSMFITYLNKEEAYQSKFRDGWYYTGDTAYRDQDGYYWFMGRSDDVINTAGHLVSPFEVESALLEIEEIAESGVIGAPDELLYEKVVAFVNLHKQYEFTKELELKIRLHVSNKVSSMATPQDIVVVDLIPKNKSGKIMRRVLKARYLGNDEGDISTMEDNL
jgi:acetyl-CoA synthetase